MNRKLKALGLALFAAFALSAVGASAASADEFVSPGNASTILTSEDDDPHEFHAFGSTVKCEVTKFSGTQAGEEAKSITVTPTYEKCKWNDLTAEVRTNHCGFVFTGETTPHAEETHARVEVECESESEHIEIEIPAFEHCNFTVENEETTKGVTYTNLEDGTVTIDVTASIKMHRDKGSFLCNILPTEGTGVYTGSTIVVGYEDEGLLGLDFTEDETATTPERGITHPEWKEGKQVAIEVAPTL